MRLGRLGEHDELLDRPRRREERRVDPLDARAEPLELADRRLDGRGDPRVVGRVEEVRRRRSQARCPADPSRHGSPTAGSSTRRGRPARRSRRAGGAVLGRARERADGVERPRRRGRRRGSGRGPSSAGCPVTPQRAAGMRTEPAVSVPSAPAARPAATAAPLPPLEPPQMRSVSHGLRAGPNVLARRRRAAGELVRVELPEDHRARPPEAGDDRGVARRRRCPRGSSTPRSSACRRRRSRPSRRSGRRGAARSAPAAPRPRPAPPPPAR